MDGRRRDALGLRRNRIGSRSPASSPTSWNHLQKSLRTWYLTSDNKSWARCCAIAFGLWILWSIICTVSLISYMHGDESFVSNQEFPAIKGKFKGTRWRNADQTESTIDLIENKWLSLSQHTVKTADGKRIDDWLWIDMNNQINVMVTTMINNEEVFVVFEQTKYGYNGLSYAIVGGHLEPEDNEDGLASAKRELLEELGMESDEWINFGAYRTDVNRGGGFCHTFLARKAKRVKNIEITGDSTEEQKMIYMTKAEMIENFQKGLFKEAKWSNTVGLGLVWMLKNEDSL